MKILRSIALVVFGLVALAVAADPASTTCSVGGAVSVNVRDLPIRLFLRELADQSRVNIAVDPGLHGRVTLSVSCVDVRTALKLALGQVDAGFCETRKTLYVSRRARAICSEPQPIIERVDRSGR